MEMVSAFQIVVEFHIETCFTILQRPGDDLRGKASVGGVSQRSLNTSVRGILAEDGISGS
jgi:hypothetical protein